MLQTLHECETVYGLPDGALPLAQMTAVFGTDTVAFALGRGLVKKLHLPCAPKADPLLALTERGRLMVTELAGPASPDPDPPFAGGLAGLLYGGGV